MIRHQFPDLQWLKDHIQLRKEAGLGWHTVILNVCKQPDSRPEIEGPFSLFLNLSGASRVATEGRWHSLRDDVFLLSSPGQIYSLDIDEKTAGETFNIHFGDLFVRQAQHALQSTHVQLLDNPLTPPPVNLQVPNRSFYRSHQLNTLIYALKAAGATPDTEQLEELLFSLFSLLHACCLGESTALKQLSPQKKSTRQEIQRRLYLAIEYMHCHYAEGIRLESLANIACLSKFHFLRLFKELFGVSPMQYIQQLRLERSRTMLAHSRLPLSNIAELVGIQNASSLSRLLKQHTGLPPSQLRL